MGSYCSCATDSGHGKVAPSPIAPSATPPATPPAPLGAKFWSQSYKTLIRTGISYDPTFHTELFRRGWKELEYKRDATPGYTVVTTTTGERLSPVVTTTFEFQGANIKSLRITPHADPWEILVWYMTLRCARTHEEKHYSFSSKSTETVSVMLSEDDDFVISRLTLSVPPEHIVAVFATAIAALSAAPDGADNVDEADDADGADGAGH